MLFAGFLLLAVLAAGQNDQPFIFPSGGAILYVGQVVDIRWEANATRYPNVTLVLWDSNPDGYYFNLSNLDFIPNSGSVAWTVPDFVGPRRLGVGVGSPGSLADSTSSNVFTIDFPPPPSSTSQVSSTSSSSSTAATGSSTSTNTLIPTSSATSSSAPSSTGLSPSTVGGIAGGIIGAFVLLGAFLIWWFRRRWRSRVASFSAGRVTGGDAAEGIDQGLKYSDSEQVPGGRVAAVYG